MGFAMYSCVNSAAGQVLLNHQRYLEGDRIVELPQVQPRQLFNFLQPVDQGIAVDKELAGCLRYIQIVFKKLMYGKQCLLVQGINGILFEYLHQEHLTQRCRQLVDQAANS